MLAQGRSEWGPSFRLVESAHGGVDGNSLLVKIRHDKPVDGGFFSVQFLDAALQGAFTGNEEKVNRFAGGIEEIHFIRKPDTTQEYLWAMVMRANDIAIRNRSKLADVAVYDADGRLCIYFHGIFSHRQAVEQDYQLCTQRWQPVMIPPCDFLALEDLQIKGRWGPGENKLITLTLRHRLQAAIAAAGQQDDDTSSQIVRKAINVLKMLSASIMADESDGDVPPPAAAVPSFKGVNLESLLTVMTDRIIGKKEEVVIPEVDFSVLLGLAQNKSMESKVLAALIHGSIEQATEPRVIRVMEVAEVGSHLVLDEIMTYGDLPSGLVMEYFVASDDSSLLTTLSSRTFKQSKGLLVRYLLFSGRGPKIMELGDRSLDMVIVNDWPRFGAGIWTTVADGDERKQQPAVDKMMDVLRHHVSHQTRIFVRGFGATALWALVLSELLDTTTMHDELTQQQMTRTLQDTQKALAVYGEVTALPLANSGVTILECRLPYLARMEPSRFVVMTDTVQRGADFQAAIQSLHPQSFADVVCMGDPDHILTSDTSSTEDLQEALEAVLTNGNGHSHLPLTAIVFLAGIEDNTVLGEVSFQRLLKLCNALSKMTTTVEQLNGGSGRQTTLWVATEGANFGTIRPCQASIQGFISTIAREMNAIYAIKHIDMSDAGKDLSKVAELVLSHGPESTYGIDAGQLKVPRLHVVDHEAILSIDVLPSDPDKQIVAVPDPKARGTAAGERFIVRPMEDPADDEFQFEIHATGR